MSGHEKSPRKGKTVHYHPLVPDVYVNEAGTQIYFKGGRYTVTPHGIEDLD